MLQFESNYVVFEKSISYLFPDLAKQWHPTKNGTLLPEHFTPGSHKKFDGKIIMDKNGKPKYAIELAK